MDVKNKCCAVDGMLTGMAVGMNGLMIEVVDRQVPEEVGTFLTICTTVSVMKDSDRRASIVCFWLG